MRDPQSALPRWGNEARDRKALAIWLTLLQHRGPGIADGAWLDVGCGSGGIAATLATKAKLVTGVDPESWDGWSNAMIEHPNLKLVVGAFDGSVPPIADTSIDVVVCNQVYEHVSDPIALVRNIHRVLVPGGVCYFAGPNLLWPIEPHVFWPFVHWLPRRFAHSLMRSLGSRREHDFDAWSWSYWKLTNTFRSAGFACTGAIRERLRAQADISGSTLARIAARIPEGLAALVTPVAPSFVFVLSKTEPVIPLE